MFAAPVWVRVGLLTCTQFCCASVWGGIRAPLTANKCCAWAAQIPDAHTDTDRRLLSHEWMYGWTHVSIVHLCLCLLDACQLPLGCLWNCASMRASCLCSLAFTALRADKTAVSPCPPWLIDCITQTHPSRPHIHQMMTVFSPTCMSMSSSTPMGVPASLSSDLPRHQPSRQLPHHRYHPLCCILAVSC